MDAHEIDARLATQDDDPREPDENTEVAFVRAGPHVGPSPRFLQRMRWPLALLTLAGLVALGAQIETGDDGAADVPWVAGLLLLLAALTVAAWLAGICADAVRASPGAGRGQGRA